MSKGIGSPGWPDTPSFLEPLNMATLGYMKQLWPYLYSWALLRIDSRCGHLKQLGVRLYSWALLRIVCQTSGEWTVSAELPRWSNLRQVNCKGSSITTVCRHIAAYCIALACYRLVCIVIHSDGLANIAFWCSQMQCFRHLFSMPLNTFIPSQVF